MFLSLILRNNNDRYISVSAAEEQVMVTNNSYGESSISPNVAYNITQIDADGDTNNYEVVNSVEGHEDKETGEGMAKVSTVQEIVRSSEQLVPGYSRLQQNIISTGTNSPLPAREDCSGDEVQYDVPLSINREEDSYSHLEY